MSEQKTAKVVFLGSVGVGKSSLVSRFINNEFNENLPTTLGAVYFEKIHEHNGQKIKFQFWDTAGQEKFKSIAKIYYKDARAALILYDVTAPQTFEGLKQWVEEVRTNGSENIIIAIVGNKTDLLNHRVPIPQVQQYANSNNALFKLISVKQNHGINELFNSLAVQLDKPVNVGGNRGGKLGKKVPSLQEQENKCCS